MVEGKQTILGTRNLGQKSWELDDSTIPQNKDVGLTNLDHADLGADSVTVVDFATSDVENNMSPIEYSIQKPKIASWKFRFRGDNTDFIVEFNTTAKGIGKIKLESMNFGKVDFLTDWDP